MRTIEVVKYDPNWKLEFQKAQNFYSNLLKEIDAEIIHVGSTSVENLWAKPILDIDIVVNDVKTSQLVIDRLISVNYKHMGDLGVKGREAMKYDDDNPYITWMQHNLYVCLRNSENFINHIKLKKHLSENPNAVDEYSAIKRKLAETYPNDIDSYIDGKTDLISSFLEKEGISSESLERIKDINIKK